MPGSRNAPKIRWGISSTGTIAGTFARALAEVPEAELLAVGSRTPAGADAFGDRYAVPRRYGSPDALAEDPDIDVVYIASPHTAHAADALRCVEAGRHVLVEKPFAVNERQARAVFDAAARAGVFVMEAMWSRFLPAYAAMRDIVARGILGDVRFVEASFGFPLPSAASDHRLLDPARAGGSLLDVGVYPLQLALGLLGPPTTVEAVARMSPTGVDLSTSVVLGFHGGALATATSAVDTGLANAGRITGTAGALDLPRPHHAPDHLILSRPDDREPDGLAHERIGTPIEGGGYAYQIRHVHECLAAGLTESPVMGRADTLSLAATLDAVRARIGLRYPADGTV